MQSDKRTICIFSIGLIAGFVFTLMLQGRFYYTHQQGGFIVKINRITGSVYELTENGWYRIDKKETQ
ncbi:MAG TPA: hypothetical protein VK815_00820 [Candidatus Acidoferrales bacterium]|jgi:hypothetical protein|nr:hypothetical protein [Candidatus Acidoferrales bacterium]